MFSTGYIRILSLQALQGDDGFYIHTEMARLHSWLTISKLQTGAWDQKHHIWLLDDAASTTFGLPEISIIRLSWDVVTTCYPPRMWQFSFSVRESREHQSF